MDPQVKIQTPKATSHSQPIQILSSPLRTCSRHQRILGHSKSSQIICLHQRRVIPTLAYASPHRTTTPIHNRRSPTNHFQLPQANSSQIQQIPQTSTLTPQRLLQEHQQNPTPTYPQIQIKTPTFPHPYTSNPGRLQPINWSISIQPHQMGYTIQHQTSNQMPLQAISQIQFTYSHYQWTHRPSNGRLQHRPTTQTYGQLKS